MQFKAIWKDTFREISKSKMRFLAILVIILLGVGFYVGLSATSPNMIRTADNYFTENNLMDYQVQATFGLTDEDIEELEAIDGTTTQSHYALDFLVDGHAETVRLFSYDVENGQNINQYHLAEGRLPETSGEIALDNNNDFLSGVAIGDVISLETSEENGDASNNLNQQEFEVVGFVDSPLYIDNANRGFTTIASGTLDGFGVIAEEDYNTDIHTQAYMTVDGAEDYMAYSEEYDDYVGAYADELESTLATLEENRANTIQDEAQAEIDDGWAEVENGEQELADAAAELESARAELDQGWADYEAGVATLAEETAAAEQEINQNEEELTQTINDLEAQRAELAAQREDLQAQLNTLNTSEGDLAAGQEQLNEAISQIDNGLAEIDNNRAAIEAGLQEIDAGISELEAARAELAGMLNTPELPEEQTAAVEAQITEIDTQIDNLEAQRQEVSAPLTQEQELLTQRAELQGQLEALNAQEQELISGRDALNQGISQIDEGIAQIDSGLATANAGYGQIEAARNTLATETANAEAELAEAEATLNEAEAEYEDGLATFEEEQATAEQDLQAAREELEQAEADLENMPLPEYQLSNRSDNNSYIEYEDNADRLSVIAAVFPIFFFLIAIFISFTTMTRMVDEEREYIGIMKALGYANRHILIKFITYSVLATTVGAILGLVIGYTLLPQLIFFAYAAMYNLPDIHLQQYTLYTTIALVASYISTVGASWLAVKNSLRSNAARLLQPKAPKSGTHILLEKIPAIWEKLSFNYKITFRNVFRYKSRMFMTIFGIAGSTGLILTGFGISDSISTIPDTQYGEINQFQAYVAMNTEASDSEFDQYLESVQNSERVNDGLFVTQESVSVEQEGVNTQDATIFVPNEPERIDDFVKLSAYESDEVYTLDDSGAYITQKLADLFDVSVGDEMPVFNADDEEWTVEVAGIVENYVGHTLYMTPTYYQEITNNNDLNPTLQTIKYDTEAVDEEDLGSSLLNEEAVVGVTYVSDVYDSFSQTLNSLDLITQILIVAAGALAFIVLYNLTNINVSERERELSTIKVLGFHDLEVTMYIYRENIILTLFGIIFGYIFGSTLQTFIMTTMEVDQLVFGKVIHLSSYAYSTLLTILFSVIVMVVIHYQLKRIDMVEALKAND
jgi:putative ABC transport system permease protein